MSVREARVNLLRETAVVVGRRWFATWREDLLGAQRPIEGGWPGTLREARALIATPLVSAFAERRMSAPTDEEMGSAMRATYNEARRAWFSAPER